MSTWFLCWWDKAAKWNRIRTLQRDDRGSKLQKLYFSIVTLHSTQYPINPNNIFPHYLSPQLGLFDPVKLAYDRPSPKLIAFLRKNYKMINHDLQPNRFAIFDGFPLWQFLWEGIYPCSPGLKYVVSAIIIRLQISDVVHILCLWDTHRLQLQLIRAAFHICCYIGVLKACHCYRWFRKRWKYHPFHFLIDWFVSTVCY